MSALLVWVVAPAAVSLGLLGGRAGKRVSVAVMGALALWLSLLAMNLPPGKPLAIGRFILLLRPHASLLGRPVDFSLPVGALLLFWWLSIGIWQIAFLGQQTPRWGAAWSGLLAAIALLALRLQSRPVEVLVMLVVGMVGWGGAALTGEDALSGLRLIAQMLWGGLGLLLSAFLLAGGSTTPLSAAVRTQALTLFGVGMALWLLVPPLHGTWQRLAGSASPSATAFTGWLWSQSALWLGLTWLEAFPTLLIPIKQSPLVGWAGATMVLLGGLSALGMAPPRRWVGPAMLTINGWHLLAFGAGGSAGLRLLLALWWPHLLTIVALGAALERWPEAVSSLDNRPWVGLLVLWSTLCLAGMPFTGSFPARLGLLFLLPPTLLLPVLLGSLAWVGPALRVFLQTFPFPWQQLRTDATLGLLAVLLLWIGLFPAWFASFWPDLLALFSLLG